MASTISKMNRSLYRASFHLMEAGKHMSNVEDFKSESIMLLEMANELVSIIQPEQEKRGWGRICTGHPEKRS